MSPRIANTMAAVPIEMQLVTKSSLFIHAVPVIHAVSSSPRFLTMRGRRSRFVERVEVQPRHAFAQQLLALPRGVLDTELRHRLVVGAAPVELAHERCGQAGAA